MDVCLHMLCELLLRHDKDRRSCKHRHQKAARFEGRILVLMFLSIGACLLCELLLEHVRHRRTLKNKDQRTVDSTSRQSEATEDAQNPREGEKRLASTVPNNSSGRCASSALR